jgi:DNA (cytosine-5)-methyltransferase 1
MLTHFSAFSGIHGFSIAAGWHGFKTIGHSEIEPYCIKLSEQNFPDIPNYGDIRNTNAFSDLRGRVTVFSAGVPCQPASLAGKRRGASDDRWLWPATLSIVGLVKPAWCIFENPPGILTLDEFGPILLRLADLGYSIRGFDVPANAVGADHLRYRTFIVADAECERHLRRRSGRREADESWSCDATERSGKDAETLANAQSSGRIRGRQISGGAKGNGRGLLELEGRGEAISDAESAGLEEHESRQPDQRETAIGSRGTNGFRLTQPPLCRRTDGIRDRSHRLKALGNSVVPQQVAPFFSAIAQVEIR